MHVGASRLPATVALFGGAAVSLLAFFGAPARAASDPELLAEIRALKERLHKLESRLEKQAKAEKDKKAKKEASADDKKKDEKKDEKQEGPDKFLFKGVSIVPGGWIAGESVWRSRWMGADMSTPFQNIPYDLFAPAHTNEFRFSARATRLSLLVKGDIDPVTHVSGYVETDFLGAAQTATSNQTNAYNPRLRQAYGNIDWDFGLHLLFGQAWTLATLNKAGIRPDTTLQPPTIERQHVPGYTRARQPLMRLTADYDKKLWLAFSVESPATTFAEYGLLPPGVSNVFPGLTATTFLPLRNPILFGQPAGGGGFNILNSYSLNRLPDLIAKGAWDASLGDRTVHVEAWGMLREFATRAYFGNRRVWAGGVGAGAVVPILPDILDFQVSGAIGNGIGRYGAAQLPDATWSVTGAPLQLRQRRLLLGATLRATPQTEIYVFAGGEFASGNPQYALYGPSLVFGGYANPFFNNLGCNVENGTAATLPFLLGGTAAANVPIGGLFSCAGQIKSIRQVTGGFWHTFYEGSFGRLMAGAQYSYTIKDGFFGFGGAPRATESMFYTSLRYYPFEGKAPAQIEPLLAKF